MDKYFGERKGLNRLTGARYLIRSKKIGVDYYSNKPIYSISIWDYGTVYPSYEEPKYEVFEIHNCSSEKQAMNFAIKLFKKRTGTGSYKKSDKERIKRVV